MKPGKRKKLILLLCIAVFAILLLLSNSVFVFEMTSSSMEPMISGQGNPPTKKGDLIVASKRFDLGAVRQGDLIVVVIPTETGKVTTVRKFEKIAPDDRYLVGATDGLDSSDFGPLAEDSIIAKVLWVIKRRT